MALKTYKVKASNFSASYNAGTFQDESPEEACEMAREAYRNSTLGRAMKDVNAFRFYVVSKFDFEDTEEGE